MRKEAERFASITVKDCWHPYGLQGLSPDKFAAVASHILKGEFDLLGLKRKRNGRSDRVEIGTAL